MNLNRELIVKRITNKDEAHVLLEYLKSCGKLFHPEDDPFEVGCFTNYEAFHLSDRMAEILKIKDWGVYKDCFDYILQVLK